MNASAALKDQGTAERFRFFLSAVKVGREEFLERIDNAITKSSLLSILNGHRRPSRTLAVLIQTLWGFKADFLLTGEGSMWQQPEAADSDHGLSHEEVEIISFMRSSVANAEEIRSVKRKSEIWTTLFARTQTILDQLEVLVQSKDFSQRGTYPVMVALALEDALDAAEYFGKYTSKFHEQRVLLLVERFVHRFAIELPRQILPHQDYKKSVDFIRPLLIKLKDERRSIHDSLKNCEQILENINNLDSPTALSSQLNCPGTVNEQQMLLISYLQSRLQQRIKRIDEEPLSSLQYQQKRKANKISAEFGGRIADSQINIHSNNLSSSN